MPIRQLAGNQFWIIEMNSTAYTIGLDGDDNLQHTYWGQPLPYDDDYPRAEPPGVYQEYLHEEAAPWGGIRFKEPAFKLTFHDETRVLEWEFRNAEITETDAGDKLTLTFQDTEYDLRISLHYQTIEEYGLLRRSASISNEGQNHVSIEQAYSAQLHIPHYDDYRLSHLSGGSQSETQLQREILHQGKKVLESRRGITSHQHNPWFAIDDGSANETQGEVYFGALAYSGSWKLVFEYNENTHLTISGGINDFDFSWHLEPGESFSTPDCVIGYTAKGFGGVSRRFHEYQRNELLPDNDPATLRPVIYNSWYATKFDLTAEQQKTLADQAASIGVELFIVDDGWFGERYDDTAGLGDWFVNQEKFPNGLSNLINHVHDQGMKFGLWVEPEMVNPDSDLYRTNPDWVYHFPTRSRSEIRNQLILNLGREDVKRYVYDSMDRLLSEYGIDFIKWDMNRRFSEPGWPDAEPERHQEIWVRHTNSVYDIVDSLQAEHPAVIFEFCAGGGGRIDMGFMERAHQMWISDNVDPYDRLSIQSGYSHAYAPKTMMNWVLDYPHGIDNDETEQEYGFLTSRKTDLEYQFHAAMNGLLGIGADLSEWSTGRKDKAERLVSQYKRVRSIIQNGKQYRLRDDSTLTAVQYVNQNRWRAVVLIYLHAKKYDDVLAPLHLRGLDKHTKYRIDDDSIHSGKALCHRGLDIDISGNFESKLLTIKAVNPGSENSP